MSNNPEGKKIMKTLLTLICSFALISFVSAAQLDRDQNDNPKGKKEKGAAVVQQQGTGGGAKFNKNVTVNKNITVNKNFKVQKFNLSNKPNQKYKVVKFNQNYKIAGSNNWKGSKY